MCERLVVLNEGHPCQKDLFSELELKPINAFQKFLVSTQFAILDTRYIVMLYSSAMPISYKFHLIALFKDVFTLK